MGSVPVSSYFKNMPTHGNPKLFDDSSHARKDGATDAWWPGHIPGVSIWDSESNQKNFDTAITYGTGGFLTGQDFVPGWNQEGDVGVGEQSYYSPTHMWKSDWAGHKRVGHDPQGIRQGIWEGAGQNLDQTYGGANYLGPSYSAQHGKGKTLEDTSVTAESFDTRLGRLQSHYPEWWERTTEESLDPNKPIGASIASLDWKDMRRQSAPELRKLISSEFGTAPVSVGEGAAFDINPFEESPQASAFEEVATQRQAALGDMMQHYGGAQQAFDHLDNVFSSDAFDTAGGYFNPLEEGANPVKYWGDWADQQLGGIARPQIVSDFVDKVEGKASDWHSAKQEAIQTGLDISSKHREIADLERSKGEKSVETRKGLLENVLGSEQRQYESGLAGSGTTPAEQLGLKNLLDKGQIGLSGIKEGIRSEREGIEGMATQQAWQEQVASNREDALRDPYSLWDEVYRPAKSDFGPDWQTEEGSWWDDVMALVRGGGQ